MFRILIYPSSGACNCVVKLPHRLFCSRFVMCWGCGNSTTQSQAPDDGYINIRNMLSTQEAK